MRECLELRLVLEELAAVKAAGRCTRDDLAELASLAQRIEEAGVKDSHYEHVEADMRFHRRLWACSGSTVLASTLDQLTTPLFAFLSVRHSTELKDLRMTKPHARLVAALRSRNADRIRREIQAHIRGSYPRFLPPAGKRAPTGGPRTRR